MSIPDEVLKIGAERPRTVNVILIAIIVVGGVAGGFREKYFADRLVLLGEKHEAAVRILKQKNAVLQAEADQLRVGFKEMKTAISDLENLSSSIQRAGVITGQGRSSLQESLSRLHENRNAIQRAIDKADAVVALGLEIKVLFSKSILEKGPSLARRTPKWILPILLLVVALISMGFLWKRYRLRRIRRGTRQGTSEGAGHQIDPGGQRPEAAKPLSPCQSSSVIKKADILLDGAVASNGEIAELNSDELDAKLKLFQQNLARAIDSFPLWISSRVDSQLNLSLIEVDRLIAALTAFKKEIGDLRFHLTNEMQAIRIKTYKQVVLAVTGIASDRIASALGEAALVLPDRGIPET